MAIGYLWPTPMLFQSGVPANRPASRPPSWECRAAVPAAAATATAALRISKKNSVTCNSIQLNLVKKKNNRAEKNTKKNKPNANQETKNRVTCSGKIVDRIKHQSTRPNSLLACCVEKKKEMEKGGKSHLPLKVESFLRPVNERPVSERMSLGRKRLGVGAAGVALTTTAAASDSEDSSRFKTTSLDGGGRGCKHKTLSQNGVSRQRGSTRTPTGGPRDVRTARRAEGAWPEAAWPALRRRTNRAARRRTGRAAGAG